MPDISAAVLSYLETLSRKDLVGLIHSFAVRHEDIRLVLEEKSGTENVKDQDNTVSAYSPRMPQKVLTAKADILPLPHSLVNRNSTAQEKINLYTSLFIGRQDVCPEMVQCKIKQKRLFSGLRKQMENRKMRYEKICLCILPV